MRFPAPMAVLALLLFAGCASTPDPELTTLPEEERVSLMEGLGGRLRNACGENNECLATAARFAGYLWEYRQSVTIQTRVYRCVGQYALKRGYRWGVRRFIADIAPDEEAPGMVEYLYTCAVPEWARNRLQAMVAPGDPPVPATNVDVQVPPGELQQLEKRRRAYSNPS